MIRHRLGYDVDPVAGIVYGLRGRPICRVAGGYVSLNRSGKFVAYAHRVVWEAVHGPIPQGLEINHINGDRIDNRIANLELVTSSENNLHAYRIGLKTAVGERNGRAIGKKRALQAGAP